MKLAKEGITENGYWAGTNGGASGVLPICTSTRRICLAWRNTEVQQGDCFGGLGGAIKDGMKPADSALAEMREEVGYDGEVTLHPAFIFESEDFTYFNFVGEVPEEFPFQPHESHAWETDFIEWLPLEEIKHGMEETPGDYHPGLIELFKESSDLIESIVGVTKLASSYPSKLTSALNAIEAKIQSDDEDEYGICTKSAEELISVVGGIVYGYYADDNPTASLGEVEGGHDFLLVDDRYLLDAWAAEYYNLPDIYDLNNPTDAEKVLKYYGPKQFWKPLQIVKESSSKMTPLQDPPEYVEDSNGWALHPDQRA